MAADLAAHLLAVCYEQRLRLATAESCTAGGIAARLGYVAGASAVLLGGVIAYDNSIKRQVLGVDDALLQRYGAVSAPVAAAMAEGVMRLMHASLAISSTGIAGPDGGSEEKPVGTVFISVMKKGNAAETEHCRFAGSRRDIQRQAAEQAMKMALAVVMQTPA